MQTRELFSRSSRLLYANTELTSLHSLCYCIYFESGIVPGDLRVSPPSHEAKRVSFSPTVEIYIIPSQKSTSTR